MSSAPHSLYPLVLLFFSAFAGATLLPLSSEVAFGATLLSHPNAIACLVVATLGNTLGITFNFLIGRGLLKWQRFQKLLSSTNLRSAKSLSGRFGRYVIYLSWLPVIGDPITIYLGTTAMPFLRFALIGYTLRFLRYYLIYVLLKT